MQANCEVWALQFPFLHTFKDSVTPSEACLYDCINCILAQAQQQPYGLSQVSTSMRSGKARSKTDFLFNVQKQSVLNSGTVPLTKNPHFETKFESCQKGGKSSGHASGSFT